MDHSSPPPQKKERKKSREIIYTPTENVKGKQNFCQSNGNY